jgi:hypothetical protein
MIKPNTLSRALSRHADSVTELCVDWRGSSQTQCEVPLSAREEACGDSERARDGEVAGAAGSKSLRSRRQARSAGCSSGRAGLSGNG